MRNSLRGINVATLRTMLGMLFIRGGAVLLALWVQIWLVAQFGASKYGEYVFFVTVCSLVVIVSKGGLDTLILRTVAIGHNRNQRTNLCQVQKDYLKRGFVYSTVVCVFLGLIYDTYIRRQIDAPYLNWWLIYAATQGAVLFQIMLAFSRGVGQQTLADGFDALIRPGMLASVVLCLNFIESNSSLPIIVSYILSFYLALLLLWRWLSIFQHDEDSKTTKARSYSFEIREHFNLLFVAVLGFVFFQMDTLILGGYIDSTGLGAYNMACNLVRIVIFVPMILVALIQPKIAIAYDTEDAEQIIACSFKTMFASVCAAGLCWLGLSILGGPLLKWIDAEFVEVYEAMMILASAHVINALLIIIAGVLSMLGKHRDLVVAQVIGAIVTGGCYFLFIPTFKERGAAFAVLAGLLTILFTYLIMFRKYIAYSYGLLLRKA